MPNPFFSGRIPLDLFEKVNQHIAKTGESKTQVLVKALAYYLDHPIKIKETSINAEVSLDLFSALEQRVVALEQSLQAPKEYVISIDNTHNQIQPEQAIFNNPNKESFAEATDNNTDSLDVLLDPWLNELNPTKEIRFDNSDNTQLDNDIKSNESILLLAPPVLGINNQADNGDKTTKSTDKSTEPQQAKLFETSRENIGPYSESKMADQLRIDRNKLRRHSDRVEEGKINRSTFIEVKKESQLYHVSYLGKSQGRKLWIAKPTTL